MSSIDLNVVRPRWKRECTKSEIRPAASSSMAAGAGAGGECKVCRECVSRYSCPRCGVSYCSLKCYKAHGDACTERFYQERVVQVLELEQKDVERAAASSKKMRAILNRVHNHYQQQEEQQDNHADDEEGPDDDDNGLDVEELQRIVGAIERGDDEIELSPETQQAFEEAIKNGKLQSLGLQTWCPWWRDSLPRNSTSNNSASSTLEEEQAVGNDDRLIATLDDHLLRIPPFSKLAPKSAKPSSSFHLQYNLVSIVYWTIHTLQQFHGVTNIQRFSAKEAYESLFVSCKVLSEDARYESIAETMMGVSSVETTTTTQQRPPTGYESDLLTILSNKRHCCHALLDSIEISRVAYLQTNRQNKSIKRTKKKLEFYLSWCNDHFDAALRIQVQAWYDDWRSEDSILEELKLR